jgi:hypothetical protein
MGIKLLWLGLTLIEAATPLLGARVFELVGSIIMIIGVILFLLDR